MAEVINGVLYSPTNANALTHGDLITMPGVGTARITDMRKDGGCALLGLTNEHGSGEVLVGWNLPILRALGCNGGGLL